MSDQASLIALFSAGKYAELENKSRDAVRKFPRFAFGWKALAAAQKKLGKNSLRAAQQAVKLLPNDHEANNTLGVALKDNGDLLSAIDSYRKSIAIKPRFAEAHNNLGHALFLLGQLDDALAYYRNALAIDPNFLDARSNLLYALNFVPALLASSMLSESLEYGARIANRAKPFKNWKIENSVRLRIGFVSGDFRTHPVAFFLLEIIRNLRALNQAEFVAYSNNPNSDHITEYLHSQFHLWRDIVGMPDAAVARIIWEDGIHVLIDLSGHTAKNRLPVFAWKPAPIQATWLGYVATTGVAEIDYLIADPWTVRPDEEFQFTEQVWFLPETMVCFTPPAFDLSVRTLPALENGYITFGCFNNPAKINDEVIDLWSRILHELPTSRLFLNARQLRDARTRNLLAQRFTAHGIDTDRLILEGLPTRESSLDAYNRVDIALDPFPYPGGTTTVEALWMGVPVLTLAGRRLVSRLGESYLQNAGLPHWIARDHEDYLGLAKRYAADLPALAALRVGLRQRVLVSPIYDAPRFAKHFIKAIMGMVDRHLQSTK